MSTSGDRGQGTYNDVELAELLVDTANKNVNDLDNIGEDTSSDIFVVLGADHKHRHRRSQERRTKRETGCGDQG